MLGLDMMQEYALSCDELASHSHAFSSRDNLVAGRLDETGEPEGNPCRYWKNLQNSAQTGANLGSWSCDFILFYFISFFFVWFYLLACKKPLSICCC